MRMFGRDLCLGLLCVVLVAGCASSGGEKSSRRSDVISQQEIMDSGANNLFDVVSRLRPQWLRVSTTRSFNMDTEIVVFQNEMNLGGPDRLKEMGPELAYELRFLEGVRAASVLPGLMSGRHIAGVIIVDTDPDGD